MRLLGATSLALLATVTVIATFFYIMETRFPDVQLDADLASNTERVADGLVYDASDMPVALEVAQALRNAYIALPNDVIYRVVDQQGKVLLASDASIHALTPTGQVFDPKLKRFDLMRNGVKLNVATSEVARPGLAKYIQVARSDRFQQAITHSETGAARMAAMLAVILALAVFGAMVFYIFNRLLKPLNDASQAAASITPQNLHMRLSAKGMPTELVPLITALNEALDRLATGYRVQQGFLATAAHELKTPLALMRGTVELGKSPDRATLLADIDGMSRQVQQLLQLAECSETHNYTIGRTDAAAVVDDAIEKLARMASQAGVAVTAKIVPRPCLIEADRGALFILVRNLLENALQHAPRKSVVDVQLTQESLTVRDHGVGITEKERPLLFRRYWRGAAQREQGSGLGLAICQQVAQAHGWSISAHAAHPGARFAVTFVQSDQDIASYPARTTHSN